MQVFFSVVGGRAYRCNCLSSSRFKGCKSRLCRSCFGLTGKMNRFPLFFWKDQRISKHAVFVGLSLLWLGRNLESTNIASRSGNEEIWKTRIVDFSKRLFYIAIDFSHILDANLFIPRQTWIVAVIVAVIVVGVIVMVTNCAQKKKHQSYWYWYW